MRTTALILISKLLVHSSTVSAPISRGPVKNPALETRISRGLAPNDAWMVSRALLTSSFLVKSAVTGKMWVLDPVEALMLSAVLASTAERRPMIARWEAPACATECAIAAPIPVPPPVTMTDLPARESSGRVGEMLG